ncbi:MAG: hypothetical protein WA571_09690, partial [Candidatus Binatus sp.]
PSGSPFGSGQVTSVVSLPVANRRARSDESDISPADARHSGIGARLDEREAPLAETLQMKPKKKTKVTETNRPIPDWRNLRQRVEPRTISKTPKKNMLGDS